MNWCNVTFRRMLSEKLYTGVYNRSGRYNDSFCPAIISTEQFDRIQLLLSKNARSSPSGRVYLFTSLLKCAECNHNMVGRISNKRNALYYYRCNQHFQRGRCSHKKEIREDVIETWLFSHLEEEIERCRLEWEVQAAARKRAASSNNKAVLKRKLSKLKELYVNELIDIEEYKKDYEIYTAALRQLPDSVQEVPPDFTAVRRLLTTDFKEIYDTLTREEKRTLWRSVIKEIKVDNEGNITGVIFG